MFIYMKIKFWIFLITVFLMANTYYDGRFTEYLSKEKNIIRWQHLGLWVLVCIYLLIKILRKLKFSET